MCKPAYVESPLALTENTCRISVSSLSLKEMKCLSWVVVSPARNFKSALSCSFVHLSIYTLWVTMKNDLRQFHAGHMTELYQLELLDCYKKGFMVVSVCSMQSHFFFHSVNKIQINLIRLVLKCLDFPLYGQAESTSHICAVGWELWQNLYSLYLVPV